MRLRVLRSTPSAAPSAPAPQSPAPTPPWRKLLRLPQPHELREALGRNTGLKLFSLLLAFFLWFSINVSERDAERVLELPVVPRRVPADLIVADGPVKPVAVTVRGPRTILDGIDEQKQRIAIDLANASAADTRVDFNSDMLRPELPRRLKVVRFEPGRIKLRVERRVRRKLPVRVALDGAPAAGYTIGQPTVVPPQVDVSGPASQVDEQKEIVTEPISVSGATDSIQRESLLAWAGDSLSFMPDRVTIAVPVTEIVVSRAFDGIPITIRNAEGLQVRVVPPRVDLTVRGPQLRLNDLTIGDGQSYVDAGGLGPGKHTVAVQTDLPPGFEVTRRRPEEVTLHVLNEGPR
jgi:YbbR domain-containing protein